MKKTVIGTAFTLLMAAFTFSSCNSSEANNAEKNAPVRNRVNKEQPAVVETINPVDTVNANNSSAEKQKEEANEKKEKEDKD